MSGGAINTPQILMLSGVGPADHLREHDIDVVQHLPGVGENLQVRNLNLNFSEKFDTFVHKVKLSFDRLSCLVSKTLK